MMVMVAMTRKPGRPARGEAAIPLLSRPAIRLEPAACLGLSLRCSVKSLRDTWGTILLSPASQGRGAGRPKAHISRKEVFQPHLPVRLPCYDLAPVTCLTLGRSSRSRTSGTPGFHGLTGGVYKARERIHRAMADARLLANPASRSRVADSDPN